METYTGIQRATAAFMRTFADQEIQIDRIAACPIMGQCNAQLIGATIKEYLLDPKIFTKAHIAAHERYKPDIITMLGDLLMEAEAIGNELKFPEDSMCISKKAVLKDKMKLSSLQLADPQKDGRMPNYLEVLIETQKIIDDSVVTAVTAGPWTIAVSLREAENLLRDTMKDPDYVHELMEFTTQMSIRFVEAIYPLKVQHSYSEASASCSLVSPRIYREFIFPYHKRIVDHFKEKKFSVGLHICGFATPILEDMVNTGVASISIDDPSDMAKAVEVTRGKAVLMGNVDTNLFYSGNRQDMERAIKDCLKIAPKDSGFIISSGCEVPGVALPEKVDWFMEIVNELGEEKIAK
jgi:uroporphyrinogen decarboxylase